MNVANVDGMATEIVQDDAYDVGRRRLWRFPLELIASPFRPDGERVALGASTHSPDLQPHAPASQGGYWPFCSDVKSYPKGVAANGRAEIEPALCVRITRITEADDGCPVAEAGSGRDLDRAITLPVPGVASFQGLCIDME